MEQQLTTQRINNLVVQLVQQSVAAIKVAAQMEVAPANAIKANAQTMLVRLKADTAPNKA